MTYLQRHSKAKGIPVSKGWNVGLGFSGGLLAVTLFVKFGEGMKENQ